MRPRKVVKKPSKNGCRTCRSTRSRIRKVKCDEARPSCQRCLSTGRTCDGYAPSSTVFHEISKHQRQLIALRPACPGFAPVSLPPAIGLPSSSVLLSLTDSERFAYDRFRSQTAVALRLTSPFPEWVSLAEQLASAHECPVVWAITAVGAMDRSLPNMTHPTYARQLDPKSHKIAMRQYGKALVSFRKYMARVSDESHSPDGVLSILLTCLLCLCFELFQANNTAAVAHARLGHLVCQRYSFQMENGSDRGSPAPSPRVEDPRLWLLAMFFQQTNETLKQDMMGTGQRRNHDELCGCLSIELDLPSSISSLREAMHYLTCLATAGDHVRNTLLDLAKNAVSRANLPTLSEGASFCLAATFSRVVGVPLYLQQKLDKLLSGHRRWLEAFDAFEAATGLGVCPAWVSCSPSTWSSSSPTSATASATAANSTQLPQLSDNLQHLALRIQHFSSTFNLITCRSPYENSSLPPGSPYSAGTPFARTCANTLHLISQYLMLLQQNYQQRHHQPSPVPFPSSPSTFPFLAHHTHQPDPKVHPSADPLPHSTLSLDLVLLPALFIIAYKCRHHLAVRRQAIALLAGSYRREGMDHSGREAFFSRATMRIEEWRARSFPFPIDDNVLLRNAMMRREENIGIEPLCMDAVDEEVLQWEGREEDLIINFPPHARFCDVVTTGEGDDLLFKLLCCRFLEIAENGDRGGDKNEIGKLPGTIVKIELNEYLGGRIPLRLLSSRVIEMRI